MNRGLFRMLLMFGPMLFRQFQKWQRGREKSQPQQPRQIPNNRPTERRENTQYNPEQQSPKQHQQSQQAPPRQPKDNELV